MTLGRNSRHLNRVWSSANKKMSVLIHIISLMGETVWGKGELSILYAQVFCKSETILKIFIKY